MLAQSCEFVQIGPQAWLEQEAGNPTLRPFSHLLMGIGSGDDPAKSGEKAVLKLVRQIYTPPYTIFDVGANKGQFSEIVISTFPWREFELHCFEPGAKAFEDLKRTIGDLKNISAKLNDFALGEKKGKAELYFDKPGSGMSSLTKRRLEHFGKALDNSNEIDVDTVDNYCSNNQIERIHLLKCDVEGHELDVLRGASKMLNTQSVNMVLFEFGGTHIDTRVFFQDYWYFFKGTNMDIFRVTPSGYLVLISEYKEIHEQFRTTYFVAIRNDSD